MSEGFVFGSCLVSGREALISQSELSSEDKSSVLGQFSFGNEGGEPAAQNVNNSSSGLKCRKRKIDKDGFVTPATPDIPKTSCYYTNSDDGNEQEASEPYETGEEENQTSSYSTTSEFTEQTSLSDDIATGDNIKHLINDIGSMPNSDEKKQGIQEVIQDMSQEMKFLHTEWSQVFGESEDFESACTSRLDKLITQAQSLEDRLNSQKEMLCQRLKGLSNTLQSI